MKIKLFAYISDSSLAHIDRKDLSDIEKVVEHTSFSRYDPTKYGNVVVGTVEVDVELLPPDEIVGNAIVALRAKAAEIRAKATAESTVLEAKVQQLLAIEG